MAIRQLEPGIVNRIAKRATVLVDSPYDPQNADLRA